MYCHNCGSEIDDNAVICPRCGVATANMEQTKQPQAAKSETNSMAVVGFILSFFVAIAGLIVSIIGLRKAPEYGGNGKGLAIAGIIISAASMALAFLLVIIEIAVMGSVVA